MRRFYEGLSAAYDFALDAEENPEEYLKLVEARGLKIQFRSPMKPVVRLAFDGMCDNSMIAQLETVLAWALKSDLPRGSLAARIQAEGGLGPILERVGQRGLARARPALRGGVPESPSRSPSTTASTAHLRDRSASNSSSQLAVASRCVRVAMSRSSVIDFSDSSF